jgi:hypothetical protein
MGYLDDKIEKAVERFENLPAEERREKLLDALRRAKARSTDPNAPRPVWGAADVFQQLEFERSLRDMVRENSKEVVSARARAVWGERRSCRRREDRRGRKPVKRDVVPRADGRSVTPTFDPTDRKPHVLAA